MIRKRKSKEERERDEEILEGWKKFTKDYKPPTELTEEQKKEFERIRPSLNRRCPIFPPGEFVRVGTTATLFSCQKKKRG